MTPPAEHANTPAWQHSHGFKVVIESAAGPFNARQMTQAATVAVAADRAHLATRTDVALDAYQSEWIKLENERGEYVRANERHRLAIDAALLAVLRDAP